VLRALEVARRTARTGSETAWRLQAGSGTRGKAEDCRGTVGGVVEGVASSALTDVTQSRMRIGSGNGANVVGRVVSNGGRQCALCQRRLGGRNFSDERAPCRCPVGCARTAVRRLGISS